ncbi:hypothetical protein Y032_1137g3670, partial [Ancylostoma ceylanicum]
ISRVTHGSACQKCKVANVVNGRSLLRNTTPLRQISSFYVFE